MSTTTASAEVIGGSEHQQGLTGGTMAPVTSTAARAPRRKLVETTVVAAIVVFQAAWLAVLAYIGWLLLV